MPKRKYYLAIVNGEDAQIISPPLDIAEIDASTAFLTEEEEKQILEIHHGISIPEGSKFVIFRVEKKEGKEVIHFYDPLFLDKDDKKSILQTILETIFYTFTKERCNHLHFTGNLGTVEHTKKITLPDQNGHKQDYDFNKFVDIIVKNIVSNKSKKNAFIKTAKGLPEDLIIMMKSDKIMDEERMKSICNILKKYTTLRTFFLEYLAQLNPEKEIINRNKTNYENAIRRELYKLKKDPKEYYEPQREIPSSYQDRVLENEYNNGEMSYEEYIERTGHSPKL